MIGFIVGVVVGGICVNLTWATVWSSSLSRAQADLRAAHRREDELEARIERITADDWWKKCE